MHLYVCTCIDHKVHCHLTDRYWHECEVGVVLCPVTTGPKTRVLVQGEATTITL